MNVPQNEITSTPPWVKLGSQWKQFTVLSPVTWWPSHWENSLRRSRRCGGDLCAVCHSGTRALWRYDVLLEDEFGQRFLFELPTTWYEFIQQLADLPTGGAGAILRLRRSPGSGKASYERDWLDTIKVEPVHIDGLVACFGLPPLLI